MNSIGSNFSLVIILMFCAPLNAFYFIYGWVCEWIVHLLLVKILLVDCFFVSFWTVTLCGHNYFRLFLWLIDWSSENERFFKIFLGLLVCVFLLLLFVVAFCCFLLLVFVTVFCLFVCFVLFVCLFVCLFLVLLCTSCWWMLSFLRTPAAMMTMLFHIARHHHRHNHRTTHSVCAQIIDFWTAQSLAHGFFSSASTCLHTAGPFWKPGQRTTDS